MKEEKTQIRFVCDNCGKKSRLKDADGSGFPYLSGWVYLYNINIQVRNPEWNTTTHENRSKHKRLDKKDKHFCNKECALDFIGRFINEKSNI